MDILIILLLFIGGLIFIMAYQYFQEQERYTKRFTRFKHTTESPQLDSSTHLYKQIIKLVQFIGDLTLFSPLITEQFKKNIRQTGWLNKNAPQVFIGSMVLLDLSILLLAIVGASFIPRLHYWLTGSLFRLSFSILFFIYICEAFPKIFLDRRKKEFTNTMIRQLPDFFDLFLIHITSGKTNIDALKETINVTQDIYPQVGQQINFLIAELQTLPTHETAWKNFADRIDNAEIRDAIKIIRHCETLGLPLERDLQLQITHIRQNYLSRLEEKITRLPTTLLLPMFLFIFPSLFVIILSPAVLKVMEVLHHSLP